MHLALLLLSLCLLPATALGHDPAPASPLAVPAAAADPAPLDLNQATVEELDRLPGIGPALAGRIVAYRDEHGPFATLDQLGEVRGIGPRTLEKLRACLFIP